MNFDETSISGAFIIRCERFEDERGFFAKVFSRREFESNNLGADFVDFNVSFSRKKGTLRGLHYQLPPHSEDKLMRCTKGGIYEVIVDMRPESSTYGQWVGVELRASGLTMLYVPKGVANGFQTLEDDSEVFYTASRYHNPPAERGLRWNDPRLGISWPLPGDPILSEKDRSWPDFKHEPGLKTRP
jgi:dTDP-4-dehydrorhamnose 3,5-epimerase